MLYLKEYFQRSTLKWKAVQFKNRVKSDPIDPKYVRTLKDNSVQYNSGDGWITYPHVFKDMHKSAMVDMHKSIDHAIEEYNQTHPSKLINVKPFSYRSYDKDQSIFNYKSTPYIIPMQF